MPTERQIQASRANGAKSRGPKTSQGKKISSRNAITHGLLSGTVVLEVETAERFHALLTAFEEELQPQTPVEASLVENMAVARWRQMRICGIEKVSMDYETRRQAQTLLTVEDNATVSALAFRALSDDSRSLELINRYETRFDRQYLCAHRRFLELRDRWPSPPSESPQPPGDQPCPPPSAPASPALASEPGSVNHVPTPAEPLRIDAAIPSARCRRKRVSRSRGNTNFAKRTQQVIENRNNRSRKPRHLRSHIRSAVAAFSDMITAFMVNRGISALALAAVFTLAAIPAFAQAPASRNRPPNLNGIWQALSAANWDLQDHGPQAGTFSQTGAIGAEPGDLGVVEGGDIPYLPEAAAKKKQNFANRAKEDPEAKCYMPGIPRAAYMPYPFQIVQSPKDILFVYEFASANRLVNMGKPIEAGADSWMGTSNGHWEGNTLVIDVTGLNGLSWFDRAGDFASDNLHVVERYTLRDKDHLDYEATIEDPKTFSRPWKIHLPLYRRIEKNTQLVEFKCVPFSEELLYGQYKKQVSK